ncbi:MAG: universal stress protein UspA related nucleotide-binding protein, partial [Haloquadratum sp. J07HQX50]
DDQTSSTDVRDGEQALSVVRSRLSVYTTVETHQFVSDSSPSEDLRAHAASVDADEFVIGVRGPTPTATLALGSTTKQLLTEVKRPVRAVPV